MDAVSSSAADASGPPGELYCTTCEKVYTDGARCPTDGTRLVKLKARTDPFVGRELDERYTVLEKLGQGGMGAVYRARQHSVDREVAIKVVSANLITDDEVIKRFLREAKLASKLTHPNAVAVLDFGQTEDGVFYLVMELVSGRTLAQELKAVGRFRPERVVRIGMQVLDALDGAHALAIVHRDLKPSNIMLMSQGRDLVKVLDFGLAKSILPDQTATTMTGTGAVLGTPAFMPPELATGRPCDGRADLYSLGVILYLLGSGRLPFVSESVHELIAMHGSDEPAPPMTGVPPRLARVIDRLLQKDPAKRFQTAAAALEALETAHGTMTPVSGMQLEPSSTTSSPIIEELALVDTPLLDTPLPPSLVAERNSEIENLGRSSTLLASSAKAAVAVSAARSKRPRVRALIALAAIVVVGAAIGVTVLSAGKQETAKAPPANSAPTVEQSVAHPAPAPGAALPSEAPTAAPSTAAPATAPVVTGEPVNEATKGSAAVTIVKPSDKKPSKTRKPSKPAAKPATTAKPAVAPTSTPNAGSATTATQTPF